eukprot:COSAG05_NODE_155_length_15704_cov_84.777315_1_plen_824_part_00
MEKKRNGAGETQPDRAASRGLEPFETVLNGHTEAVSGCALSADGSRALTCSADKTARLWDLSAGRKQLLELNGHTEAVSGCALSADGSRALTCSADKTARLWDLSAGGKQLLELNGHTESVSGCALSADGSRALTCSADKTARLWDLSAGGKQLLELNGHTEWVSGCALSADGSRALTCSADKTARLWDLSAGGKELLEYRRWTAARVCCCAFGIASSAVYHQQVVTGVANGQVQCFDVNDGYDPSTNLVWNNFLHAERDTFTVWLAQIVAKRRSVRFLFQPDRLSGGKTMVHKFAALEHGAAVFEQLRDVATRTNDPRLAEDVMGMLQHAQSEPGVCTETPLVAALQAPGQENAQFLLDAYLVYAEQNPMETHADATGIHAARWHLRERDLVLLFRTYPNLAASFLEKLPLHQTGMVKTTTRYDFADLSNAPLLQDDTSEILLGGDTVKSTSTFQFWENVIACRDRLSGQEKAGVFVTSHMVPVTGTPEPVVGIDRMHQEHDVRTELSHSKESSHSEAGNVRRYDQQQSSFQEQPVNVQLGIEYDRLLLEEPGGSHVVATPGSCDEATQKPPYSQLLKAAVAHVDRTRQPLVFEGPTLQTIVQHKWETSCRDIFMLMFQAYAVFLVVFVLTTLLFETWLESDSGVQHSMAWSSWGFCVAYSLLLLKRECHQVSTAIVVLGLSISLRCVLIDLDRVCDVQIAIELNASDTVAAAIRSHFDFWNIIDVLVALLSMASLVLMAVAADNDAAVDIDLLRCFQATAGLLGGIKLLSFLRGLDFSAFLISMLEAIVADMVEFFAVLLVIMGSCASLPFPPIVCTSHCV